MRAWLWVLVIGAVVFVGACSSSSSSSSPESGGVSCADYASGNFKEATGITDRIQQKNRIENLCGVDFLVGTPTTQDRSTGSFDNNAGLDIRYDSVIVMKQRVEANGYECDHWLHIREALAEGAI